MIYVVKPTQYAVKTTQFSGHQKKPVEDAQEKANEKVKEVVVATMQVQLHGVIKQTQALVRRAVKKEHIKREKEDGRPTKQKSLYNYHNQAEHQRLKGQNMSFADKARELARTWNAMSDEERERRYGHLVEQDKERFLEESKKWEEIKERKLSLDERKPAAESSPQEELATTTEATNNPEDPTTAVGSPQEADPDNYQPSEYEQLRAANIARNNERLIRLGLAQGGTTAADTAAELAQAAERPRESSSTSAHEGAAANLTRNDTSAVINDRSVRAEINQEVSGAGSARAAEPPRESNQEVTTSVAAAAAAVNPDEDGNDQLSSPSETNKEGGKRKRNHELLPSWYGNAIVYELEKDYIHPNGEVLKEGYVWIKFDSSGDIEQVKKNDLEGTPDGRLRPRRLPRHNLLSGGSKRSDQGPNTEYPVGDTFQYKVRPSVYHRAYTCTAEVIEVIEDGKFGVLFSLPYFGAIRI
jgi:hypothetical protein